MRLCINCLVLKDTIVSIYFKNEIRQIMKDPTRLYASLKDRFKQLFKETL